MLPIVVRVYNMGALFMATNGCGKRLKHVDTRHHFVQNYAEKRIIKIIFIPTNENTTDVLTKNNSGDKLEGHTGEFMFDGSNKS